MINNYYEAIGALGLTEGASKEEIKQAFRSLSKKYHPDLYKGDNGEAFRRINQARQYLQKYQDSPKVQTVYHQKESYNSRYADHQDLTERQKRTAKNRARQAEKIRQRQANYTKLFNNLRPYVLFVLVLNTLLALDYMLPRIKDTAYINSTKKIFSTWKMAGRGLLELHFDTGDKIILYGDVKLSPTQLKSLYTYHKTMIFRQQMYLYNESRKLKLRAGYNVFKVFGFIILIQLIAVWRYFAVKDVEVKLSALAVMGFFIFIQLLLLLIR